jgi:hypothetical protein
MCADRGAERIEEMNKLLGLVALMGLALYSCTPQQLETVRDARNTAVTACESQVLQWAVVQAAARDEERPALDVANELCLLLKSQCIADTLTSLEQKRPVLTPEVAPAATAPKAAPVTEPATAEPLDSRQ